MVDENEKQNLQSELQLSYYNKWIFKNTLSEKSKI